MLDDPCHWPEGAGLYCLMNAGGRTINNARFQVQPMTNDEQEVEALWLSILGLSFVLLLEQPDEDKHPFLRGARFRPARIIVSYPSSTNWLTMSWEDGKAHEELTLQFEKLVPHPPSAVHT